jgi:hypothetical protein
VTTTSPSWFDSWPSSFKDLEDAYLRSIPRQWPQGLFNDGTDERRELDAIASVISWTAQGGEWIKQRIHPQHDANAQFLHLWEECFALARAATTALRQSAIISHCRLMLGTATKEVIQRIMAPVFGVDDPALIDFSFASRADIDASGYTGSDRAFLLCQFHIHANGSGTLDRPRALDTIAKWKPTWIRVTVGQHKTAKYDTQGGYDTACYGA